MGVEGSCIAVVRTVTSSGLTVGRSGRERMYFGMAGKAGGR
jgi:hypothetical protein